MASLSGVSSSNTVSSLMNSANTITGLASGLDTESMIESLVQSYQTKIESLNKNVTKVEWKQEAYRSIISQLVGLSNKYTSYTSSSNLMSPSFFSGAVNVTTLGAFADKVSASGKSSSDISLDRVSQLATAAQYRTSSDLVAGDGVSIQAEEGIDLMGQTTLGTLDGSLALTYGSKTVSIQFDKVADVESMKEIRTQLAEEQGLDSEDRVKDSDVLARLIENKLAGQSIAFTNGGSDTANNRIKVEVKGDGSIQFSDKSTAGNSIYISSASSSVKEAFGLDLTNASTEKPTVLKPKDSSFSLTTQVDNAEYLSGKSMNLSLNGSTKTVKLPTIGQEADGTYKILDANGKKLDYTAENYTKVLNDALNTAFKGKVTASNVSGDDTLQLRLEVEEGSDLVMNTDVGETLGIGRTATTYMNTSKTLGELLGKNEDGTLKMDDPEFLKTLTPSYKKDSDGNIVKGEDGQPVLLKDDKGNQMYDFEINGTVVGSFSKESKLSEVIDAINNSDDAGVKVSYSQTTKNFLFTSKETGADSEIKIGGGLAEAMFGTTEVKEKSGSFAETYGISWLEEGESEAVTFRFDGFNLTLKDITADQTIEDVADELNKTIHNNGYVASYNKYTGKLEVTDKSGAAVDFSMEDSWGDEVKFDEDHAPAISYTPGQDAKFTVTVNGEEFNMTRSSNTVAIDGLTITMKDTFDGYENEDGTPAVDSAGKPKNAVTFKTTTDSDKIVDAVKTMIGEYNAVMSEIKSAYATLPYQKSDGSFGSYEPLSEDDKAGMSESAIERYEEKAKQGILFGDSELSALYSRLRKVFEPSGEDSSLLRAMGISTTYNISDGSEAVVLDEDKLRSMLDSDPDKVADLFTKSNGIMQNMKNVLDTYAKTTGEPKGILVQKSGTPLSSLSLLSNTWQTEIDNYNTQIEKWQDKLASQVERYTSQFTRLETLINQMNSQSSTLAGMMGG